MQEAAYPAFSYTMSENLQFDPNAPWNAVGQDQIAQAAQQLTVGVTEVPSERMVVRNEALPTAEQDGRAERIGKLFDYEAEGLRERIMGRINPSETRVEEVHRIQHFLAVADAGDEEALQRYGIDAGDAWLDDVAKAVVSGWPVETEAFAPRPDNFRWPWVRDTFDFRRIHRQRTVGADIASMLRRVTEPTPNVRLVAFAHDYDGYAEPVEHPAIPYARDRFIVGLGRFLTEKSVLHSTDTPGQDFLVLRETDQVPRIDELKERLAQSGNGRITNDGKRFRPSVAYSDILGSTERDTDIFLRGIPLEYRDGAPSWAAVNAASFINPADEFMNHRFVHLLIRPADHEAELRRAKTLAFAGELVPREVYHRIFYDTGKLSNEMITYGISKLLQHRIDAYKRSLHRYNDWPEANPEKYALLHYGTPADEDRQLIPAAIDMFEELGMEAGQFENGIDIGTGSNWYQIMLGKPFVRGRMAAREFSPSYRVFLEDLVAGTIDPKFVNMWKPFEELMVQKNPELYEDCLARSLDETDVEPGSIYDLAEGEADYLSAFFVLESIVDTKLPFWQLFRIVGRALRPRNPNDPKDRGGIFAGAFMVGSEGWEFGDGTFFPAVNVTFEQIEQACRDAGLDCKLVMVGDDGKVRKVREGYKGMAFMVARHKEKVLGGGR